MDFSQNIAQQTRSVRDVVYEKMKEAILMEQYKPGFRLNERELARQFRISTTPLKEAFRLLEQEGLVVTRPRVGTYVSADIMTSIEEIHMVRAALEGVGAFGDGDLPRRRGSALLAARQLTECERSCKFGVLGVFGPAPACC